MNEPQFVEASRALAERTLREAGPTTDDRLTYMFRLATARPPDPKDLAELSATYQDFLAHYTRSTTAADELLKTGEARPDPKYPAASWPPGR